MKVNAKITLVMACSTAAVFALAGAASLLVSRPAAVLTFALLDAERRGAEVEAPR